MSQVLPQPGGGQGSGSFQLWSRQRHAKKVVQASDLPQSVQALIFDVTRASRLWRAERADLATELCAHFGDGLEAGQTAEQLISDFGDPKTAAQLMRRSKKRCRSLVWRILRWTGRSLAALFVLWVGMAVYFFVGEPTVATDYHAKFNALAASVPEQDRAWPIYRNAFLALKDHGDQPWDDYSRPPLPGENGWDRTVAYLEEHRAALDLIRTATRKPGMGYIASNRYLPEDAELFDGEASLGGPENANGLDASLVGVMLPYLSHLRNASTMLHQDALRAASKGQGVEAVDDVEAMIGLARHTREQPALVNDLVALAIVTHACQTVQTIVERHGPSLTDVDMKRLAHVMARTEGLMDVRMSGERMMFYDIVQRMYTDDGDGDGRLTSTALTSLHTIDVDAMVGSPEASQSNSIMRRALVSWVLPALSAVGPSRKQAIDDYDREVDRMESRFAKALWQLGDSSLDDRIAAWRSSWRSTARHVLLMLLLPAVERAHLVSEVGIGRRDATYVLIAAELYRREQGQWPTSVEALAPRWLPIIPRDRFDGKPLRFRVTDKGVVIYSVGADLNDDGGRRAKKDEAGNPVEPHEAQEWLSTAELSKVRQKGGEGLADGDLVFYPMPVEPLEALEMEEESEGQR